MPSDAVERLAVLRSAAPTAIELVSMVRDGDNVIGEAQMPEVGRIDFSAVGIRRGHTGIHARVQIAKPDGAVLAFDNFNVERDAERLRLSNSAAKRLGDIKRHGEPIRVRFDEFCRRVWETFVQGDEPEMVRARQPEGVDWLLEPFIARGAGTILYGPPKACKSWLGMLWAASMSGSGGPWRAKTADVLFVNLERPAHTMSTRLWCVQRALGGSGGLRCWNKRGRSLSSVAEAVKRHSDGVELIVVDSLSRSGTGDLNANDAANEAMDLLNGFGVAWCILAHTPRADTSHVYGSQMFDAAADLLVRVNSVTGSDNLTRGVLLDRQAANDAPPSKPQLWAFDFDELGLSGVRSARAGEFPDLEPQSMSPSDRIADYLTCEGASTAVEMAEELDMPQGTIRRILNSETRFTRLVVGGRGKGSRTKWGVLSHMDEHL